MRVLWILIKRDTKLFFKDKGMFFTALITPMILLVLYATFLGEVYKDSFATALPPMVELEETLINGFVGSQLMSSLLAVCCVSVAFCSNLLMVQDKVTGSRNDFAVSPVRGSNLAAAYSISTLITTLIVCLIAAGACFLYLAKVGWYLSGTEVLLVLLDVLLLSMFGTALSSVIHFFLSTQGQISAVGAIISAGYGFICGAYMPISQFGEGIQKVVSFFPGTYGTSLVRNHCMQGVFREMESLEVPVEVIETLKEMVDCKLYFFDKEVDMMAKYGILGGTILVLLAGYILIQGIWGKKARR